MSVPNGERLATKQDLADMYQGILPYLGGMPEMVANKFSKGDLYSTDEKMIGQWIDGKPLYAKTINTGALSNTPNKKVAHSISNLGEIVSMLAIYHRTDGKWFQISNVHLTSANKTLQLSVTTTNVEIESSSGDYSDVDNSYVTLQYTKTTDTAISIGEETEYSTDEKVVGTWIDGKPLYQRTFHLTNPLTNWTANSLDIVVDKVFLVNAYYETSAWAGGCSYYNTSTNMLSILAYKPTATNIAEIWIKGSSTVGTIKDLYVTLQYTKTTDTAD